MNHEDLAAALMRLGDGDAHLAPRGGADNHVPSSDGSGGSGERASDGGGSNGGGLAALADNLRALVEINVDQIAVPSSGGGGEGRIGFGVVRFADQRFYSVKLGNLARDRLGAAGLAGAMMTSGTGIAAMIAAGAVTGWVGGAALVAIGLALIGRGKPFVATFGLDEATALSMAWALSSVEHGFRLVSFDMLVAHLKAVEATYRNAGFTEAKLTNALNRLKALGMIADAGAGRYQLVDRIRMTDVGELRLTGD